MPENYFESTSGSLFYREKNSNKSVAIVFLHGNSLNSTSFDKQFHSPLLSNYRLVAIDLPGHGRSNRQTDYSIPSVVRAIKDFCNSLPVEEFILVGHSLGGHLAIQSLELLEKCKGLFIFGTPPLGNAQDMAEAFLPNPVMPLVFKAELSDHEIDDLAAAFGSMNLKSTISTTIRETDPLFRELLAASIGKGELDDEKAILIRNNIPVAIIHGGKIPW